MEGPYVIALFWKFTDCNLHNAWLMHRQHNIMKSIKTIALIIGCALAAGSANASITVGGSAFWNEATDTGAGASNTVVSDNFDASGFDKLVVVATGEHGWPGVLTAGVSSLTYDGVNLVEILNRGPIDNTAPNETPLGATIDQTFQAVYYLDNPSTSTGLIQATWNNSNVRGNITVFGLNGTAAGYGSTIIGGQEVRSVNLTTSAGSIVIGSLGLGGNGNTGAVTSVDTVDPTNFIETSAQMEGGNWDGQVTAYQINTDAGTNSYAFTGGSVIGSHIVAVEFLAIPEPSSVALLGLGGLALIIRRRR